MEPVHWVVVGGGLGTAATAYSLLDVHGAQSDAEGSSLWVTLLDVAVYGCTSGTLVYGAVSGHGVAAFAGYFAVAALVSLVW